LEFQPQLVSFHPAAGDWVAVYVNPRPNDGDPWFLEPIIGWAAMQLADGSFEFLPIIGGETLEASDEWIGVYRRADVDRVDIRTRLREVVDKMAANAGRASGCGAP